MPMPAPALDTAEWGAAPVLPATPAARDPKEAAQVAGHLSAITYAREFDIKARKDYAFCRRYARGDSQFDQSVNLIGTYIDILVAFLYARDPDIDCNPADRIEAQDGGSEAGSVGGAPAMPAMPPPGMGMSGDAPAVIPGSGMDPMAMDPALALTQGGIDPMQAMMGGGAPGGMGVMPASTPATGQGTDLTTLKTYGRTMQIVLSRAWKDAKMKRQAERWLRSCLTTGIGWIKTGWQANFATDPVIEDRKRDIQENLARIERLQSATYDEQLFADQEAQQAALKEQLRGLEGKSEIEVARGIFIDVLPAEDIQVALNVQNIVDCDTADWIAHRTFMTLEAGKDKFKRITQEEWATATIYHSIKPTDESERRKTAAVDDDLSDGDASPFRNGAQLNTGSAGETKYNRYICVWEKWDATTSLVMDLIEGVKAYGTEPTPPNVPTTRFFPFFPLALHEVDGERHPQSLVMRSFKLMDEYNRARTGLATLRARTKPRVAFDSRAFDQTQIDKIVGGTYAEWIPITPSTEEGLQGAVWEVPYPKIDPALFDVMGIKSELETLWGIQEALTGGIEVAKTATEAEIQQSGTNARTGSMRDRMERVLTEIAQFHAEIAAQEYTLEDVRDLAGPGAIWIEGVTIQDLGMLLQIDIRAGSTGKPNTSKQREAWAAEAPVIRDSIMQIGALLQSPPQEIARCLTELLRETVRRAGENLDVDLYLPKAGNPIPLIDPATGAVVLAFPAGNQATPGAGGGMTPMPAPPSGTLAKGGDPSRPQGNEIAPIERPAMIE